MKSKMVKKIANKHIHDCNNVTCELLNPSLERLLRYEDLRERVSKVEDIFFDVMKQLDITKSLPLGLFGWATDHHIYQLLNIEFIQELAKKIKDINPDMILEVGSGEGSLGKYLSKELNRDIILTDDYSWWDTFETLANNNIIKMDYKKALNSFKPDLIIASWIPYKRYWTKDFRECESVKGYILIGEGHGGCTGSDMDWKTNWIVENFKNVEKFGICRSDHGSYNKYMINHSNITYFKRPNIDYE